jgi:DNA-binding response OmpR family regulator
MIIFNLNRITSTTTAGVDSRVILLIDDDESIRKLYSVVFSQNNYECLLACDGREGINVYQQNLDKIDLVLLDYQMPFMNGLDCFKEIRKLNPSQNIVFFSGSVEKDITDSVEAQTAAFIPKTDEFNQVVSTINSILNSS